MTLVLNIFGGPGIGKSTSTASVFAELKTQGVNCEMALEWVKEKVWEDSYRPIQNQIHVFGQQHHRIWRLIDQVDVVISDSPLLNSILYYQGDNEHFTKFIYEEHRKLNNLNVVLTREKAYNPAGRYHNEEQAKELDVRIRAILEYLGESYHVIPANRNAATTILQLIEERK